MENETVAFTDEDFLLKGNAKCVEPGLVPCLMKPTTA
jgi:hypothetical protein